MALDILEEVPPYNLNGSHQSPRPKHPVILRGRIDSNDSENSNGSGRSRDSPSVTLGVKFGPGSAPGSRAGSFRERPRSTASSRRSPTPRRSSNARSGSSGRNGAFSTGVKKNMENKRPGGGSDPDMLGPRRSSMPNVSGNLLRVPNAEDKDKLRRVRSFKTTSKGVVVNRGDSFKKKSTHSLMSTGSTITEPRGQPSPSQNQASSHPQQEGHPAQAKATAVPTYYRVIMMGAAGCGKSLITEQFMTSDFVGGGDDTQEVHERTVTVLLDGEESTIEFIDPPDRNVIVADLQQLLDAYVVVFAINDNASFQLAKDLVRYLRIDYGTDRVILLVANKIDLVRKRKVSADEARLVAETFDCKYTETSAALNHYIDELLVGILTQIRLHMRIPFTTISFPGKEAKADEKRGRRKGLKGPKSFFSRLFRRGGRKKTKPCENLHAL